MASVASIGDGAISEAGSSEVAVARDLFRAMDMTFWLDDTE